MESQKNDPDTARMLAEQMAAAEAEGRAQRWSPRPAEWSLQHELMAAFFDRLGDWLTQYANSQRGKGQPAIKPPPRFPRPKTVVDRERAAIEARVESELDDLIDRAHAVYRQENEGVGGDAS